MQWGAKNCTQIIGNPEFIKGYEDMNKSIIFDFEVCGDDPDYRLTYDEAKTLLSKNKDGSQNKEVRSLLNFTNSKYLIQNLNNFEGIKNQFGLSNINKAKGLSAFYNNTLATFKLNTNSPELSFYRARFSRDGLVKSLDILKQYVFNNITMKAFNNFYINNKGIWSCKEYFLSFQTQICNNNLLSLDKYDGVILWVLAFYQDWQPIPGEIDARKIITETIDHPAFNFNAAVSGSKLNVTLGQIQVNFTTYFGCFEAPCDRKFLAELQYYKSSVTNIGNLNDIAKQIYPSLTVVFIFIQVKSVAMFEENKQLLINKIPEIYGFYKIHFNYDDRVFGGEQDKLFSSNQGIHL